jgi:ferric-dicitrate binding protein FerR (iron transport regulator)
MSELRSNATRRRRTTSTEVASSHKTGRSGGLSAIISVTIILAASVYLMAHNQVDEALGRTATVISDKSTATGQVWTSVVTTFAVEDAEEEQLREASAPDLTMLKDGDRVTTGSYGRTVATSGNDILRLEPNTTITIGEPKPATIIELLGGTLHVKAAKRQDGDTLSIETQYLVATVKGTEFVVTTTESGAAVSVTEGVVSVRSISSSEAFDVVPGQTAIVSSVHGLLPTIVATPAGGGGVALEAAVAGTTANSNHHRR